ncbi:MAG: hypothetical protein AB8G99_00090 [Planctomycetaceae bacterium]
MDVASRLSRLVERRNKKITAEAGLDLLMGAGFLALLYGGLLFLSWLWFYRVRASSPGYCALGLTFATAMCCGVVAWRQVDPFRGLAPMTQTQKALTFISQASPNVLYFSPLHAGAGLVGLMSSGFEPLFEGIGRLRNQLSTSDEIHAEAATILVQSSRRLKLKSIRSVPALLLLKQLSLVRVEINGVTELLRPTEKGERLLSRTRPRQVVDTALPGAHI